MDQKRNRDRQMGWMRAGGEGGGGGGGGGGVDSERDASKRCLQSKNAESFTTLSFIQVIAYVT